MPLPRASSRFIAKATIFSARGARKPFATGSEPKLNEYPSRKLTLDYFRVRQSRNAKKWRNLAVSLVRPPRLNALVNFPFN